MNKYEIMCYGDSNTWGTVARWREDEVEKRYDRDTRWPCILQKELGSNYAVTEEGIGGRTTIYTDQPDAPYKNGLFLFEGCLSSHKPLDLVIILLGTNDIHMKEKLPQEEMGKGIRVLAEFVKNNPRFGKGTVKAPEVLIIAPTVVVPSSPEGRTGVYPRFFYDYGGDQSKRFPEVYKKVAEETGCYFLNAQDYATPDPGDGVHLSAESHIRLGKAVADAVRKIREETENCQK